MRTMSAYLSEHPSDSENMLNPSCHMADNEEKKSSFRVVDRRRFDSEGNEKGSAVIDPKPSIEPRRESAPRKESVAPSQGAHADESFILRGEEEPNSVDFSSFVVSLATQALMQLGEMPAPPGYEIPQDPEAARQTIDILTMLKTKTRGNLDQAEAQMMEEVLHSLRLAFVKHSHR